VTPLRWIGAGVLALLLVLLGFVTWMLDTESGAQQVARAAVRFLDGKLAIQSVQGKLVTPLLVTGVRWKDPEHGVDVLVESASVDLAFSELFSWRAHVKDAKVAGVTVKLSEPTKPPEEEKKPFTLKPPIDIVVDRFTLQRATVSKNDAKLFEATRALLIASWTGKGVGVKALDVESPQGRVDINGTVAQNNTYNGQASGTFRWKQGDYDYAGALKLNSDKGEVKLDAHLTSPLDARVTASVQQTKMAPWKVAVHVPTFDPRKKLLPDSSLQSLMVALDGHGDNTHANVKGEVTINGAKVFVDPIKLALGDQVVKIEALSLRDAEHRGVMDIDGNVRLDKKPFWADVAIRWRDVLIPKQVAGQQLVSHGEIKAQGNADEFNTRGALALGPPGKLADITLAARGTPAAIELEKLSVVQKQGDLSASGHIGLKPHVTWQIGVEAHKFDPGALLADWPGSLGFKLDSDGELVEAGPNATFKLENLAGTLRQRQIAGDADLKLTPNKAVAGTLNVKSGRSTVHVTGAGGQTLDVAADFDVASMEDWLPKSKGQINGHITAKGEWPKIAVKGNVKGQGLALNDMSARNVNIDADVQEPLHPRGSLNLTVRDVAASGFAFASIDLQAEGNEADHSAHLKATGKPISTEVRVKGSRVEKGWSGTVQSLTLDVPNLEQLALRQPVQVKVIGNSFDLSESCLANSQLSACAAASQSEAGELQARYVLEHLPLALVTALTTPDLGYIVKGTIEGKGDVRRTAEGALFGNASVTSSSGSVAEEGQEADPLLSYTNFQFTANLNGETARATTQMAFNNGGVIEGEVSVGNVTSAAPTLDGHGKLSIGDLSPIGLFVTQLANIKGSANGEATIAGTVPQPNISGSAHLKDFSAELPVLGLQLKDGLIDATASGAGAVKITGHITSGDGQVQIDGGGESLDALVFKATGKNVLAANIPAAHVVVTPDLDFTRKADRMDLTGKVTVENANIDLTKLPKGNNVTQASPDIVVVDDPAPDVQAAAKSTPLYTSVVVVLGEGLQASQFEKIKLVGFGLDAKLGGQLTVSESPGSDPLGAGEIRVTGTYKAYGQDLTIETGRLLYANTPLGDPQVDLVAVRVVEEVTAKLTVKGSAHNPLLEVSSDPPMAQTAALSYLVTGKPLEGVGSGESDLVQSAARSLGGAAGNLLAKSLGKRLGVSDIGVTDNQDIGGSAFTVGQYLSPRLYISYGVGLFEPGQVVTLRYRLSRAVNVEASQSPKQQRAGVNYKVEK
jgi:translocation and assembly module TamB